MISLERMRAALPGAAGIADTPLLAMRDRALDFIQTQTWRYFGEPQEVVARLEGNGTRYLRLPDPVRLEDSSDDITEVLDADYPGATPVSIGPDGFDIRDGGKDTWLVRLGPNLLWTQGHEFTVTYQRGYAMDQGPGDIEQLVLDLVGLRVNLRGREGLRSESIGGYSYARFGEGDLDSIDGGWATIRSWRYPVMA